MTNTLSPCTGCGLTHQCICHLIPKLDSQCHILLLSHANELQRPTNTGKLLSNTLANTKVAVWERGCKAEEVDARLVNKVWKSIILFPAPDNTVSTIGNQKECEQEKTLYIILDATWQEAKKMYRKTPWLQALPHLELETQSDSTYSLRRNQESGHLCTCEVGIELLHSNGEQHNAQRLQEYFEYYLKAFKADKSGHALK